MKKCGKRGKTFFFFFFLKEIEMMFNIQNFIQIPQKNDFMNLKILTKWENGSEKP